MRHLGFSCALGLLSPCLSQLSEAFAPQTASPVAGLGLYTDVAPLPTEPPSVQALEKRAAANILPNICGWFSGSTIGGEPVLWSYYNTATTCYWNSDYKIVGDESPIRTTCIDDGSLNLDSDVLQCASPTPYCMTFFYSDEYRAYMCASSTGLSYQMLPYYDGLTTSIAFPTYTGSNGVSIGTQYPSDSPRVVTPIISETTSSSTSSDSSSFTDSATPTSSSSSSDDPSSSSSDDSLRSRKSKTPIGAIVGGVIGGLAVIAIAACAIIYIIMRSRKRNNANAAAQLNPEGQNQPPPSDTQKQDFFQPGSEHQGYAVGTHPPHFQPQGTQGVPPPGVYTEIFSTQRSEMDSQSRFVPAGHAPHFREHTDVHEAP